MEKSRDHRAGWVDLRDSDLVLDAESESLSLTGFIIDEVSVVSISKAEFGVLLGRHENDMKSARVRIYLDWLEECQEIASKALGDSDQAAEAYCQTLHALHRRENDE